MCFVIESLVIDLEFDLELKIWSLKDIPLKEGVEIFTLDDEIFYKIPHNLSFFFKKKNILLLPLSLTVCGGKQ